MIKLIYINVFLLVPHVDLIVTTVNSENFRENFIFGNSVKTHTCDVKTSQQGCDLPISVNERVISPICEGFIFTKLPICEF